MWFIPLGTLFKEVAVVVAVAVVTEVAKEIVEAIEEED